MKTYIVTQHKLTNTVLAKGILTNAGIILAVVKKLYTIEDKDGKITDLYQNELVPVEYRIEETIEGTHNLIDAGLRKILYTKISDWKYWHKHWEYQTLLIGDDLKTIAHCVPDHNGECLNCDEPVANCYCRAVLPLEENKKQIRIILGDITTMKVDCIVNAANNSLLGGGGIDGAIHKAAGPELLAECKTLGGCATGGAVMTDAYNLPCTKIIHTVGPVYKNGKSGEADLLETCYANCLHVAIDAGCKSIVFPAISTGIYGYPLKEATEIAINTVLAFILRNHTDIEITFVCWDENILAVYNEVVSQIKEKF